MSATVTISALVSPHLSQQMDTLSTRLKSRPGTIRPGIYGLRFKSVT